MPRIALIAALVVAPALLLAQGPGGGPPQQGDRGRGGFRPPQGGGFAWWDSPIAADLNLSDQQQAQIRTHTREFRNRLFDASNAVKKAEAELEDIMNEENVDQKRASDAIEKVASARAEMTRSVSLMSLRLRSVLTYQQWQELQKRAPQHPGGMGPGGRDGGREGRDGNKMRKGRPNDPPPPQNKPDDLLP